MFEHWYSSHHQRGITMLEIHMSNLVKYLDFLQVKHLFSQGTQNRHATAICNILDTQRTDDGFNSTYLETAPKRGVQEKSTTKGMGRDLGHYESNRTTTLLGRTTEKGRVIVGLGLNDIIAWDRALDLD